MAEDRPVAAPPGRQVLCRLEDIADGDSAAFEPSIGGRVRRLMVLRQGERVFVYENRCPHLGWPLDIVPGRFLDASGRHILCTGHGALFRIADGYCVKGPCIGLVLTPVPATVERGLIALSI